MRKILGFIILCFTITVTAQSKDSLLLTRTEWVNSKLDYIRFFKDSTVINLDEVKQELLFDIKKRDLSFKLKYSIGGASTRTEEFNFKIKQLYKNKLVIVPLDSQKDIQQRNYRLLDCSPFFKEQQITFYNRALLISRVKFKKITFHASTCFGTCPSMSVEINSDGSIFYQGRMYTKKMKGNFEGKLEASEFYKLRKMLNRSQLKALVKKWKQKTKPNDTPRYNYIVELIDGNIISINTNDQHPLLDKLSAYFIDTIPKIANLVKTKARHKFEESPIDSFRVSYTK